MPIQQDVPFLPDSVIEDQAMALLRRYELEAGLIRELPVPVERIADPFLALTPDWDHIPDTDASPILAYIDPANHKICFNESRRGHFESYYGSYEYTLGHEIGHYVLHLSKASGIEQLSFIEPTWVTCMFRKQLTSADRRELQAEKFASYLLLPKYLLEPALEDLDLLNWPTLYSLRDKFRVSITALKRRLESIGRLYVDPNGGLHNSKEDYVGQSKLAL